MMVAGSGQQTAKYYFHSNHLYSVAALTNSSGQVVERYKYDAFGKRTVLEADGSTVKVKSSYGQTRGFTGYSLDEETGLYYARSRMYSAGLGRFVGRDSSRQMTRAMVSEHIAAGDIGPPDIILLSPQIDFRALFPKSMDGYEDGMNLYHAYFIPNGTDPSGMWLVPCNWVEKLKCKTTTCPTLYSLKGWSGDDCETEVTWCWLIYMRMSYCNCQCTGVLLPPGGVKLVGRWECSYKFGAITRIITMTRECPLVYTRLCQGL
jgi:RHS repeat-associated protein